MWLNDIPDVNWKDAVSYLLCDSVLFYSSLYFYCIPLFFLCVISILITLLQSSVLSTMLNALRNDTMKVVASPGVKYSRTNETQNKQAFAHIMTFDHFVRPKMLSEDNWHEEPMSIEKDVIFLSVLIKLDKLSVVFQ